MNSTQADRFKRRLIVMRDSPIRLSNFIDEYRQELGCSRETAAFAAADLLRRLEARHSCLDTKTCWVAEVLDHAAQRSTSCLQTAKLIRYFELQSLSKSNREPFILVDDAPSAELRASDGAIYFSPSALTRLVEEHWGQAKTPKFIFDGDFYKKPGGNTPQAGREHLRTRELLTVKRLTGTLVAMITACANQEEARRVISNAKLCKKDGENKGPFSTAESLAFIADRLGLRDLPDTDTVAKYLPGKPEE